MTIEKILIAVIVIHTALCSAQDPNLTVEKANEYIAANKASVNETYKFKYHFSAPIGWINDPNGFIYYQGEYHLFYQYNPYNSQPYKVHWGHAKSKDLVHWEHLPVALAPDQTYDADGVFSGTSIEKDGNLYVMYTGNTPNIQVQCIAVSDDGITFQKIKENPVLNASDLPSNAQPQDFRDPKVFKRDDTYYAVTISKTKDNTGQVLLFQSPDLINWQFKSILLQGTNEQGVVWECPDIFELDGKDVLIVSAVLMPAVGDDYKNIGSVIAFIGTVNWTEGKFNVETVKELDHGLHFYATQTMLDDKKRRIAISWMNMWGYYPTSQLNHGWAGGMTLPRVLRIKDNYLVQTPIAEITDTYDNATTIIGQVVKNQSVTFSKVNGRVAMLELELDLGEASSFTIEVRKSSRESTVIKYDTNTNQLYLNVENSEVDIPGSENRPVKVREVKVPLVDNELSLQIFLDKSSIEIYANGGRETFTANIYPTEENSDGIQFTSVGTTVIDKLCFSNIVL